MALYKGNPITKPFMNGGNPPTVSAVHRRLNRTTGTNGLRKTTTPDSGKIGAIKNRPPYARGKINSNEGRVTSPASSEKGGLGNEGRSNLGPTPQEGTTNPVGFGKQPRHNVLPTLNRRPGSKTGGPAPGSKSPAAPLPWKTPGLSPETNNAKPNLQNAVARKMGK